MGRDCDDDNEGFDCSACYLSDNRVPLNAVSGIRSPDDLQMLRF